MPVIRSLDQLLTLPRKSGVNGFGARAHVELRIAGLSAVERNSAERALNRFQLRCGCVAAGVASLAVVVVGAAYVCWHAPVILASTTARQLGLVLGLSLAAGAVAKLITLLLTRMQFERQCRKQYMKLRHLVGDSDLSRAAQSDSTH